MIDALPAQAQVSPRMRVLLWSAATLLALAAVSIAALLNWLGERTALRDGGQRAALFVGGAETAINRTLLGIDVFLAGTAELLRPALRADGSIDPVLANRLLQESSRRHLWWRDLLVFDANAAVLASSTRNSMQGRAPALPADFLALVLAQAVPALALSAPSVSAASGEFVLYLARPLQLSNQRLVIVAEVPVSVLGAALGHNAGASDVRLTLERADGLLLASTPAHAALLGQHLASPIDARLADGMARPGPGRLDRQPALVALLPTLYPGILLAGSMRVGDALLHWRGERNIVLCAAAAFLALLVTTGALVRWQMTQLGQARNHAARTQATLEQAVEAMGDGFLLCDRQDRVVLWNRRFVQIFPWLTPVLGAGVPFQSLLETTATSMLPAQAAGLAEQRAWIAARMANRQQGGAAEYMLAHGQIVHVADQPTADGGSVSVCSEISERWHADHALRESEARMRTVADALPLAVAYLDSQERYRFYNVTYGRRFALPLGDICGKTMRELLGEQAYGVIRPQVQAALHGETVRYENQVRSATGSVWCEALYVPQLATDGKKVIGFHSIITDITERKLEELRLQGLAQVDALTGLLNRAGFDARLAQAMSASARTRSLMAVMYLDIDRFKSINDAHGHAVGDAVIRTFALRLKQALRTADTVARLGGDEFTVILENVPQRELAAAVADKILEVMAQPITLDGLELQISTSMGLALHDGGIATPAELLKRADGQLYRAKHAGRNNWRAATVF